MNLIDKYYEILEVNEKNSLKEIKRSFRLKAKLLHPDVNKAENAKEQLIKLLEAYEYLVNHLTGKAISDDTNKHQKGTSNKPWQDDPEERAKRAEYYSNLSYKEFEKSEYFKKVDIVLDTFASHIPMFALITLLLIAPIGLILNYGKTGFYMSLVIWFFTSPVINDAFRKFVFKPKELKNAFIISIKTNLFSSIILAIINFYVIFFIGFQTLIPLSWLLLSYLLIILSTFIVYKYVLSKKKSSYYFASLFKAPFLISAFLFINFYFSINPKEELYIFEYQPTILLPNKRNTTLINIQNNKYKDYIGIRVFLSFEKMKNGYAYKIKYTFKDGLFGIRVMTDYKFYN